MEAVLDTSFIISCIKRRIDFMNVLAEQGFTVKVPNEVVEELKDLRLKVRHDERIAINVALELFSQKKIKKLTLGSRSVDEGLISKGKQGAYIATLDREIKRNVPYSLIISAAQNSIIPEVKK